MLKALALKSLLPGLIVSAVLGTSFIATTLTAVKTPPQCGYGYVGYGGSVVPIVSNVVPNHGSTAGGTTVTITGSGFCTATAVNFGTTAASSFNIVSDTEIQAVSPAHAAGTIDVTVTNSFGTSPTSSADKFTFAAVPTTVACITTQKALVASDGATWQAVDSALTLTFTAGQTGFAELGGNADLWTGGAGVNQDLGIAVTGAGFPTTAGQPEAWKESGGKNGTFSPNAAFVHTVIAVASGQSYTEHLVWKANQPTSGAIYAGAGPVAGKFSQTCIDFRLFASTDVVAKSSTQQYTLANSDGTTWQEVDSTNLSATMVAPGNGMIIASENADLWTTTAGFNQDLGILIGGSQPAVWKESGGNGGTFSPNAAFGATSVNVTTGASVTASLVWKANHSGTSVIAAGAGPIGGKFSPTKLTLAFIPSTEAAVDKSSSQQYALPSSDGSTWQTVDFSRLTVNFTPTNDCEVILGGNADLFTNTAGVNQDLGVSVNDNSFPSTVGQPEGWKESGGGQGTFSPNAAYVQIHAILSGGHSYTIQLVWKANHSTSATIFAGAGPVGSGFSQTHLMVQPIGC